MSEITTTNPGTIKTFTHRANLRRWQNSPRFKAMKKEHALKPGAICAHCKRQHGEQRYERNGDPKLTPRGNPALTSLTINHMSETSYLTEDLYCTWDPAVMEVCCIVCNNWDRKGKEVCPVCKVNPILKDDPVKMCIPCYLDAHPEIKKQIEADKEKRTEDKRLYKKGVAEKNRQDKKVRPCVSWKIGGTCGLTNTPCKFTPSKMLKMCDKAVAKKKFVTVIFPCRFKLKSGRCGKSRIGAQCTFSKIKCLLSVTKGGCPVSKARVKKT